MRLRPWRQRLSGSRKRTRRPARKSPRQNRPASNELRERRQITAPFSIPSPTRGKHLCGGTASLPDGAGEFRHLRPLLNVLAQKPSSSAGVIVVGVAPWRSHAATISGRVLVWLIAQMGCGRLARTEEGDRTGRTPAVPDPNARAPFSFRGMKPVCFASIAVRHSVLPGFCRWAEKIGELAEIDVDHRRRVKRQKLRQQQSTNDRDAERAAQLRSGAGAERERQAAE